MTDIGFSPDPVQVVHRHVLRLFEGVDHDMVHFLNLPDGYNAHNDGIAVVVNEDVNQDDETAHARDLVRVSVYGPEHQMVRNLGRNLHTALTQGLTGIGMGVDRSRSTFFGSGPSFQPTGFVSTMSISVGIHRMFRAAGSPP